VRLCDLYVLARRLQEAQTMLKKAKRGRRCLREPAHGLGEWPRAMARRRRLLPDLRISAAPMLAGTHSGVGA
jgi:hypothetical protein